MKLKNLKNLKSKGLFPEPGVQWDWEEVVTLLGKNVIKIVGTQTQTVALTKDGDLYVFGDKEYLGLSSEPQHGCSDTPVLHPVCLNDGGNFWISKIDSSYNNFAEDTLFQVDNQAQMKSDLEDRMEFGALK